MAITTAEPRRSGSAGIDSGKETHQEMEHAVMSATPTTDEDPNAGKLTKDVILAYLVSSSPPLQPHAAIPCLKGKRENVQNRKHTCTYLEFPTSARPCADKSTPTS